MRVTFFFFALFVAGVSARAHDPGLSSLHLVGRPGWGEIVLQFAPADFILLAPIDLDKDGRLSRAEFEAGRAEIERVALSWVEVRQEGRIVPLQSLGAQFQEQESNVVLSLTVAAPPLQVWTLHFLRLGELPARHRQLLTAAGQSRRIVAEILIDASQPQASVDWHASGGRLIEGTPEPTLSTAEDSTRAAPVDSVPRRPFALFGSFLLLGLEHILIGYDHLLFLAGLLLACRQFKSMVAIITSFTLAHSITLALATFQLVNFPGRFVEPAIAASIVYVGVENILRRDQERSRWLLTFCFGLIHGFGFAGVLRELGIGQDGRSFAAPLIGFNLGVELGQIVVAAIFLPLLFYVRRFPWFERRGQLILSALVAAAGLYWLVERLT